MTELYITRERIARQGEANIELERTLRHLDQKIGLLVAHRTTIEVYELSSSNLVF
jgi:hypothetical protein